MSRVQSRNSRSSNKITESGTTVILAENTPTVHSALALWWRQQRNQKSGLATARLLIATFWEFLCDSLPYRRSQRYGDFDFDWEHRVDTTSATVGWRTRLIGVLSSPYQPIPPEEFRELMNALAIDFSQFTFIDVGSGKGRALLLAAEYGFRRIIGIEWLLELDGIAQANIERLRQKGALTANIELVCMDATDFAFPAEPTLIFLFNPLTENALRKLLRNLEQSLRRNPRLVHVAYANPILEHALVNCSCLVRSGKTPLYALFRSAI